MAVAYAMRGWSEKVYGDRRGQVLVHINGESSYLSVVEAEALLIDMTHMASYIRSERNSDHVAAFKIERDLLHAKALEINVEVHYYRHLIKDSEKRTSIARRNLLRWTTQK